LPELRINFHHHMVLVKRSKHGRDLPLSERIVKCVIDQLRRDAQARRSRAVIGKPGLQPGIQLVAVHVGETM
jgi:hypothetical protein